MYPFTGKRIQAVRISMFKLFLYPAFVLLPLFFLPNYVPGELDQREELILSSAEKTFNAMKAQSYKEIWNTLSQKSREAIVNEVHKANTIYSKDQIASDLSAGGMISRSYWTNFLENFNPDTVLLQSRWELGHIGKDKAVIKLTHLKSKRPADLKLYLEDGNWKVGLTESFGLWNADSYLLNQIKSFVFGRT